MKKHLTHYALCHLQALKTSARQLYLHPILNFFTCLTIGLALALPLTFYAFLKPLTHLSQSFDQSAEMSLYLKSHTEKDVAMLMKKAKSSPLVTKAIYLNPSQVLKEFQEATKMPELLSLFSENPLPGIIKLQLSKNSDQSSILALQSELAKEQPIEKVILDAQWLEKLKAILALAKMIGQILGLLIGIGILFIIGNTLRLALEHQKEEIEVFAEVGATKAFIRRPFLYRGILYGLIGGILAIFILDFITYFLQTPSKTLASLYQSLFSLSYLSLTDRFAMISLCALLGWLGAQFAFMLLQYRLFKSYKAH